MLRGARGHTRCARRTAAPVMIYELTTMTFVRARYCYTNAVGLQKKKPCANDVGKLQMQTEFLELQYTYTVCVNFWRSITHI